MRILAPDRVLFTGRHLCPELYCPKGPLPNKHEVLLCLLDGAERRRHLQVRLNRLGLRTSAQRIDEGSLSARPVVSKLKGKPRSSIKRRENQELER
jgi:hypothetical protein